MSIPFIEELERCKIAILRNSEHEDLISSALKCDIDDIVKYIRNGNSNKLSIIQDVYKSYFIMLSRFYDAINRCGEDIIRTLLTQSSIIEYIKDGNINKYRSYQELIKHLFIREHESQTQAFVLVYNNQELIPCIISICSN